MNKRVVMLLERAKARISDPRKWCREYYARDADGVRCSLFSSKAAQWCAMGALKRETPFSHDFFQDEEYCCAVNCLAACARQLGYEGNACLNDTVSHEVVMQMYDRAIAQAKEATHAGA